MKRKLDKELKLLDDLINYMKKNDLTQEDIARILDVRSVSTVNRWLNLHHPPRKSNRKKIRELLEKKK